MFSLDLSLNFSSYSICVTVLLILYICFDVNYFLRIAFTIGRGRLFGGKKKADEETEVYGFCTTQDVDIFFKHMNNARYTRELDFARFHFYDRTGIYDEIMKKKGHALQTATYVRYRRTIPIFSFYKVTTKIIQWNEKELFLEHRFVTLSDGFIRAIVFSRQGIIGMDMAEIMGKLLNKDASYRPIPPPELEDWLKSIEKSSQRLRKRD